MTKNELDDDLRPEYDLKGLLKGGERGKYAARYRAGRRTKMGTIALEADFRGGLSADEVRSVVGVALRRETELARARRDQFARDCRAFEERNAMHSDEFMRRFEAGELGDAAEYFDWFAAKRGLDVWDHKLRVLSAVSV